MRDRIVKWIMCFIMIIVQFVSCKQEGPMVNSSDKYSINSLFVIDYDVILYNDGISDKIVKKLDYFDPIILLSDTVNDKGRIKVQLANGDEGWIEEIYTSFIQKSWIKLLSPVDYFCYFPLESKLDFSKDVDEHMNFFYYWNKSYDIRIGVSYINDYNEIYKSNIRLLKDDILSGQDKNKNWTKEFVYGDYKINYTIKTDFHDGSVNETFYFVKLNEINVKKCYSISIGYNSIFEKRKQLFNRKILFSALQSLK